MRKKMSLVIGMFTLTSVVNAFDMDRDQTWEVYLSPQFVASKTLDFKGGAKAELNERASLALGIGYNFDEHFGLGVMFNSASANYTGTAINDTGETETFVNNMYTSSFNLRATYHFLEGNFTPYITGNLGWTYIDSGISTGEEVDGCWWDPWWGYICYPYNRTYSAHKLNYGAELGIRYDLDNGVFFKGGIGLNRIDLDTTNNPDFTVYNLSIGFMFD